MSRELSWATFHRWEFDEIRNAADFSIGPPRGAHLWLCGSDSPIGKNGLRNRISAVWSGAAFYDGEVAASGVIDDSAGAFASLPGVKQAWHALLLPVFLREEANWFDLVDATLSVAPKVRSVTADPGTWLQSSHSIPSLVRT